LVDIEQGPAAWYRAKQAEEIYFMSLVEREMIPAQVAASQANGKKSKGRGRE